MATFSYIWSQPKFNLNRATIIGLNIVSAISNLGQSGRFITFDDPIAVSNWQIAVDPRFFPPSSNYYTLDFTLVASESFCKIGGIEVDAGVLVWIDYNINEYELRIQMQPLGSTGQTNPINLVRPSPYWYPYSS